MCLIIEGAAEPANLFFLQVNMEFQQLIYCEIFHIVAHVPHDSAMTLLSQTPLMGLFTLIAGLRSDQHWDQT
jgi:hypothetical protein